jgi:hypothetical protein
LLLNHAEGVAVSIHDPAWKDLPIWNEKTTRSPDLGSARAIFAYLVSDALDLCSRFVKAYWSCVGTPQAVADDLKCYLRSPLSHHLLTLPMVLEQPWERLKPGIAGDSASTPPTEAS